MVQPQCPRHCGTMLAAQEIKFWWFSFFLEPQTDLRFQSYAILKFEINATSSTKGGKSWGTIKKMAEGLEVKEFKKIGDRGRAPPWGGDSHAINVVFDNFFRIFTRHMLCFWNRVDEPEVLGGIPKYPKVLPGTSEVPRGTFWLTLDPNVRFS